MESNDKLKETDMKNHTCWYFDDVTRIEDSDVNSILIEEKQYENILAIPKYFTQKFNYL